MVYSGKVPRNPTVQRQKGPTVATTMDQEESCSSTGTASTMDQEESCPPMGTASVQVSMLWRWMLVMGAQQ